MKRTIATLGVVGLGLLGATVSANAAPSDKITICHATHSASNPYVAVTINLSALSGHIADTNDIVPANAGNYMPNGQNLTPENIAILNAGCKVAGLPLITPTDPVTTPPADPVTSPPTEPVTTPSVTTPPVEHVEPVSTQPVVTPVVPPVAAPAATVPAAVTPSATVPTAVIPSAAGAAATPDAPITNVGYNVQTAVGGKVDTGIPAWLAGLTGLFSAVAVFVVARSGVRARKARH
ncbi:hypothetical protein [Arthrobacter bambusae]|uniref:Sortase n=1 Tax=Arthrobacter bambusae TaxID=1338426 RepID=A0AAW8DB28_9MICC|nr:hypothetical protein [Arthrobacter bambusae]MDP9904925.1 hypothetical protein [Arthrobacter bambusae]MDQ0129741.1 hypothetical protein [Arthrobacter bambusae]MDQ0181121.1 hypothetical protein [Arthrobacter bambusae]